MNEYTISYDGWEANQTMIVKARNESEAIHKVLTADGAPWCSVIEIERSE